MQVEKLMLKISDEFLWRTYSSWEYKYRQRRDGIFISQDKYIEEILKKFGFTEVKTTSTPIETQKPLLKDENGEEVDVHMYRVNDWSTNWAFDLKRSHSDLVHTLIVNYARAKKAWHRKSTTGGCQFLGAVCYKYEAPESESDVAHSESESEA
ncbi:hypothetical protein Tco_0792263 [Tanacetum coccineum]